MASRGAPPDFVGTVRANHARMKGLLWARSGACLTVAREEVRRIRRNLELLGLGAAVETPRGRRWWLLAVLLCPGDTTEAVSAWARSVKDFDAERVRFYLHTGADPVACLTAWHAAGLPNPATADFSDFADFHKQFGWDFNNQVYRDATLEA